MILVPPIKCQGIKTKLVPSIRSAIQTPFTGQWIEPFCGSCVVALNVRPQRALLTDTNQHIITFYQSIKDGVLTAGLVKEFLQQEGNTLRQQGGDYYYEVRERFNTNGNSLDFLFLNRACFNGVMRFNKRGHFNVPFGNKPDRFRPAYITKIVNQVKMFKQVLDNHDWHFAVADFRLSLARANEHDFIYVDPPYSGRHTDYYNTWDTADENELTALLQQSSSRFLLSTWHHNQYRENDAINNWQDKRFSLRTLEHFYHVGATEALRSAMTEALIANYPLVYELEQKHSSTDQMPLF
ncbi:MAG: Dam family site-specific DNA-(adenine-N6)-methyltransferase [Chloroflexota bacterium]